MSGRQNIPMEERLMSRKVGNMEYLKDLIRRRLDEALVEYIKNDNFGLVFTDYHNVGNNLMLRCVQEVLVEYKEERKILDYENIVVSYVYDGVEMISVRVIVGKRYYGGLII